MLRRRAKPEQDAAARRQLGAEAAALLSFTSCPSLPRLVRSGLASDPPALLVSPVGMPLADFLCSLGSPDELAAAVETLACDVLRALCCAHRCGVLHNDLRPSNVIAVPAATGAALSFVLIDWGLCTPFECEIDGVVGYAPCACSNALRAALREKPWSPTRSTDVECLSYLCAAVLHGAPASSIPPWANHEKLAMLSQCADETSPMKLLLQARETWLKGQPGASLPKRVLNVSIALAAMDAARVLPPDNVYRLPGRPGM